MNKQDNNKLVKQVFLISGMHCSSCSINIDGELEDTEGVLEAKTSYAKQQAKVSFNPEKISEKKIIEIIKRVGYTAVNL